MLPILRLRIPEETQIPWEHLAHEFEQAPKEHDLEKGAAISTWNWSTNPRLDLDPWFKPIKQLIEQTVQETHKIPQPYNDWVMNTWMNRHWRGGQTQPHKHEGCDLVFACYLSVPENSGAFLLKYNDIWYRVPVTTGDILVFPGMLEHATEQSNSDEPRTVFTVNASPTGMLWRDIKQPEELVAEGLTMPQALGLIREQYLNGHYKFTQAQKDNAVNFIKTNQEVYEIINNPVFLGSL